MRSISAIEIKESAIEIKESATYVADLFSIHLETVVVLARYSRGPGVSWRSLASTSFRR